MTESFAASRAWVRERQKRRPQGGPMRLHWPVLAVATGLLLLAFVGDVSGRDYLGFLVSGGVFALAGQELWRTWPHHRERLRPVGMLVAYGPVALAVWAGVSALLAGFQLVELIQTVNLKELGDFAYRLAISLGLWDAWWIRYASGGWLRGRVFRWRSDDQDDEGDEQ